MSTHKHIDKICLVAAILSLVLCAVFMNGEALGIQAASRVMGYEERLFDTSEVHTIDIIIDDWDAFLETAQSEEYSVCSVVIDGEAVTNVGIRGKGNTSLSTVSSMNSDRYSFKIEFDQYDSTKSYHGLDKLSLNNIIQDNTYMKDYLTYQMMGEFGVAAPLCSYAYLTVNGEDWGLYLAVEAVEESFLQRNYGSNYGDLYKPDSMDMGGGRGNGRDFEMPEDMGGQGNTGENAADEAGADRGQGGRGNRGDRMQAGAADNPDSANGDRRETSNEALPGGSGGGFTMDEAAIRTAFEELGLDTTVLDGIDFDRVTMEDIQTMLSGLDEETIRKVMQSMMESGNMQMPGGNGGDMRVPDGGGGGGMGSAETRLQYIDDDPDSYSTIFSSAKTDVTAADQNRLISSLKQLSEYEDLEKVVNIEAVLRYFVVHNYVVNGDSYTGSMIHNYYLYEEDGQLSMIPWDYNLAFGTFQGGSASSSVNEDIDDVLSDRPMQAWIFSDETYSQQYYALYAEMLEQIDIQGVIDSAYELIAPYVEKDPTAFCTYTEFQIGVETLKEFCELRTESVKLQLSGSAETVDVGTLDLSDMGTMNMGGMGGGAGGFGDRGNRGEFTGMGFENRGNADDEFSAGNPANEELSEQGGTQMPGGMQTPESMTMPEGAALPEGMQMPGTQMPGGMQTPGGMQSSGGTETSESGAGQEGESSADAGAARPNEAGGTGNTVPFGEMPDFGDMGNFGGGMQNGQASNSSQVPIVLLAVSALTLAAGLLVAFKFRR